MSTSINLVYVEIIVFCHYFRWLVVGESLTDWFSMNPNNCFVGFLKFVY